MLSALALTLSALPAQRQTLSNGALPCFTCGVVAIPKLEPGSGPHAAKACCSGCGRFLKWIAKPSKEESLAMDCLNMVAVTGTLERDPQTKFEDNGTQFATC